MFSKARITRFNEVEGCAPPPGSYDPKFEEKLVGGVLSKTQRFLELTDDAVAVAAITKSTEHLPKKTPMKTPKYVKPLPKSSAKKKITTSLQDLSKVLQNDIENTRFKDEIEQLKAQLEKSQVLFKRVETWVSSIEDSHIESLSFIVEEWNQCSNLTNLKSFGEQEKELDNAFNQIVELRAVVAENEALVSSMQTDALAASERYSQMETSLSNAQEGNNNLQNLVSELGTSKLQLQQQLEQKCNLMVELLAADEALQKELVLTKNYSMSLEENFNTQTQELRSLKMQVAALEELAERKANLESINENLEAELRQAKEEGAVLRLNLASTETTLEIVKEERSQLAKNLQDADEGILAIEHQLRLKNEEFGAKIDGVSTKALFLDTQMETLQTQLMNTIDERDNLKTKLEGTQNTLTNLQEKHEATLVTLAEEMNLVQHHEDHIMTLTTERKNALVEANAMGAEVIETRQGMLRIQDELKQALTNEKQLQQDLLDAKRDACHVRDRINSLEERLERNFTDNGNSKKILATFTAKVVEFEAQKKQLANDIHEKGMALERINALYDSEVKAKEKLLRKLTGTKSMQKNLQDKLSAAESELQTLNDQLAQSQDKESKVSIVASELKKQVAKLEEKVLAVGKEKDKTIQELSKINDVLRREIEEVQSSLESIQFYKESIKSEVDKTVNQNEILLKENESMKSELKKASEDLLVVQEELRGAKEHLQQHLCEANLNIHMLKQQLSDAQSEVTSLKQESIEANESIFELCSKLLNLEALLNETRARNTETLRRIAMSMDIAGEINVEVVEKQLASLNKYVEELEDEFAESVLLKMKVEDELEEEKLKATSLCDQVFDICQEKQDIQMCLEAVSRKLLAIEEDKQALEDEFAKAEKEWDVRELKLMTDIKLLGEEAKEAEEKQIQFEGQIMELNDEVKILKGESKWEEEKQLKMEEEFAGLLAEKDSCIQQYTVLDKQLAETKIREAEAVANIENFWEKMKSMSDVVAEVKGEVKQYADLLTKQDENITVLEELIKEKDEEMAKNNGEKDEAIRLLEGKLQDQEAAMKRLLSEVESRVQAADEMEDLLQRKIAELQRTKENVGKLEAHSKSLLDKTLVLEEKEMRAQSDVKKAQAEAAEAAKALEIQQHEFSTRWSAVEDSLLNVESIEDRNKDLSASDLCLRSQVSILEGESNRLRSLNSTLRERLLVLEKDEAKSSGHQNHLQKLSYMQNLKEVVFKHEKNEEDMHELLVASECKVAQLEAELQKHGISVTLSKSLIVEGSSTKKSRHGKENRSLMASLSRTAHSFLSSSSPMHRKSPLQPKNH